ncbi:MAG: FGGY-family carbohydrate kinase [Cyanobacteria bacterium P01_A01_bin.135]
MTNRLSLGIDFGTSGARAIAIDPSGTIQAEARRPFSSGEVSSATAWRTTLFELMAQLPAEVCAEVGAIAINGTSSTVLRCDSQGEPVGEPILYNDSRGEALLERIDAIAPPEHVVRSASSSLAKLLWWHQQDPLPSAGNFFLHQADWLAFLLHGQLGVSDYHNSLKLGYDVVQLTYPDWFDAVPRGLVLPRVVAPGTQVGPLRPAVAQRYGIPQTCQICAGTTDSIAAFLASGAAQPGEAVTSLGSTLVLKLLSTTRVEETAAGVYSHRFGDLWLAGGASNTGGAVLAEFFTPQEIDALTPQLQPQEDTGLGYYPLRQPGERFPVNDPNLPPQLAPRPKNPAQFLQGLLEGIARIEAQGYIKLQSLGATPLQQVYSAGGGAKNGPWRSLRNRYLGVPVLVAAQTEAAYGSARLAAMHHGQD